jgi:hypothetical protein
MNDLKGAIAPMEKLVALYPEEKKLKGLFRCNQATGQNRESS